MTASAPPRFTPAEYLALERQAELKHEYIDGRIIPWLGATLAHCEIMGNLTFVLHSCFKGRACQVYASQMRVRAAHGRSYLYPDVVAIRGEMQAADDVWDTLTNPTLIIEVLSPSTEAYDRGEKFAHYRTIETLQQYMLVAQDRPVVDVFARHGEFWRVQTITDLDQAVELTSVGCTIPLRDIYENVEFPVPVEAAEPAP